MDKTDIRIYLLVVIIIVLIISVVYLIIIQNNMANDENMIENVDTFVIEEENEDKVSTVNNDPLMNAGITAEILENETGVTDEFQTFTFIRRVEYNDYIFDFRENGIYCGFFDSEHRYVDRYKWVIKEDGSKLYVDIVNEEERVFVRWMLLEDPDAALCHEATGIIIPIVY